MRAWLWSSTRGVPGPWLSSSSQGTSATICSTSTAGSNASSSSSESDTSSNSSSTPDITTSTQQLRDLLNAEHLSYRAQLSMLMYHAKSKHPMQPESVASNIAALKQQFGADLVNRMLETAPTVATRPVDTLHNHYESLRDMLGGNDALARSVVARSADVLTRSPAAIAGRVEQVQQILQVRGEVAVAQQLRPQQSHNGHRCALIALPRQLLRRLVVPRLCMVSLHSYRHVKCALCYTFMLATPCCAA